MNKLLKTRGAKAVTAPVPAATHRSRDGFDLFVGRTGFGTLRIDAFGRAEIEDSVLIGDSVGAIGNLIIDGFNSSLINGGSFDFGRTTSSKVHMTIIGRQGTGNLTISNAATMVTQVFATGGAGNQGIVGASLGSLPYTLQTSGGGVVPAGGNGTATITGAGSRWSISGSMQIGGFDNGTGGGGVLTTGGDLEGDDVEYGSQAGRGTLNVNEGGFVQVQNANGAVTGSGQETALVLAIGRFSERLTSQAARFRSAPARWPANRSHSRFSCRDQRWSHQRHRANQHRCFPQPLSWRGSRWLRSIARDRLLIRIQYVGWANSGRTTRQLWLDRSVRQFATTSSARIPSLAAGIGCEHRRSPLCELAADRPTRQPPQPSPAV